MEGSLTADSPRKLALLFLPRMVLNPCLHATTLIRLASRSPTWTLGLWRTLLIAKHTIDIQGGIEIGPGLVLPHPYGITFGWGVRIERNATVLHFVTIGGLVGRMDEGRACPTIGEDVVIYANSFVLGPITLGKGAIVGAGSWVDHDLAPGEVHRGLPKAATT